LVIYYIQLLLGFAALGKHTEIRGEFPCTPEISSKGVLVESFIDCGWFLRKFLKIAIIVNKGNYENINYSV